MFTKFSCVYGILKEYFLVSFSWKIVLTDQWWMDWGSLSLCLPPYNGQFHLTTCVSWQNCSKITTISSDFLHTGSVWLGLMGEKIPAELLCVNVKAQSPAHIVDLKVCSLAQLYINTISWVMIRSIISTKVLLSIPLTALCWLI